MNYQSVDALLKGYSRGVFKNENETCQVISYYEGNNRKFKIYFVDPDSKESATRFAISTTSENKVLKVIKENNFLLQKAYN